MKISKIKKIMMFLLAKCVISTPFESILQSLINYNYPLVGPILSCSRQINEYVQDNKRPVIELIDLWVEHYPVDFLLVLLQKSHNTTELAIQRQYIDRAETIGRCMQNLTPSRFQARCTERPEFTTALQPVLYDTIFSLYYHPLDLQIFPPSTHDTILHRIKANIANRFPQILTIQDNKWQLLKDTHPQYGVLIRDLDDNPVDLPVNIIAEIHSEEVKIYTTATEFNEAICFISDVKHISLPKQMDFSRIITSSHPDLLSKINSVGNSQRTINKFLSNRNGDCEVVEQIDEKIPDVTVSIIVSKNENNIYEYFEYRSVSEFNAAVQRGEIIQVRAMDLEVLE